MMRLMICLSLFALLIQSTGCSLFAPKTQMITITTSEPDAQIFLNGSILGTGVVKTEVKRNANLAILAKKDGFNPATCSIGKTLSSMGMLDIAGGIILLIPFIGLAAAGAWELQEENVVIPMFSAKE